MPLFQKKWGILINISWLFPLYHESEWLKEDVQDECKSYKIIIQLD